MGEAAMSEEAQIDFEWRAIRIAEVRADGFVAFDFHVGDPQIYAEMVLPMEAFQEFCAEQGIEPTHRELHTPTADGLGFSLRDAAARAANSDRDNHRDATTQGSHHAA
jgi:phenol/toluene 2-monooxygenase (NADH) P0/A0